MAISVGWWAAATHDGLLEGDGVCTVRRPAELEVIGLTPESHVEQGAVLARFHSPEAEAVIAVLRLRLTALAAEERVLRHQVLATDPEIAQKLADANAYERTLRTNLNDLTLEKERLERESLREQLARQEEIRKRELEIHRLDAEADQARSALQLSRDDHVRSATLRQRNAISAQQHAEKDAEVESLEIEVRKIEDQGQQTRKQEAELEQGLQRFLRLTEQQGVDLRKSIAVAERRLEEVRRVQDELHGRRDEDRHRAERHRDECLGKITIELAQTEKQLAAEQDKLEKRAPFAGPIAYRTPAPGNAGSDEPLLVLAPPDGFRLNVRLPLWAMRPLERAAVVSCRLLEDLERDEQRRFVECRFTARVHRWNALVAHSGYGLAEFTCEPPAEAVRLLARGEQIAVRLVWRPPLYAVPAFMLSLVVTVSAGTVWLVTVALRKGRLSRAGARPSSDDHGTFTGHSIEFGAEGELLRLLGIQVREMTVRGELDTNVIAAAEWALARHRHRAVQLLSVGLGDGPELCGHLEALAANIIEGPASSNGHAKSRLAAVRRLTAVLQAAAPNGSYETIRRIARKLSHSAVHGANGEPRRLRCSKDDTVFQRTPGVHCGNESTG